MENKEDIPKFANVTKESLEGKVGESAPATAPAAVPAAVPAAAPTPTPTPATPTLAPGTPAPAPTTPATPATRTFISPLAKTILRESGAKVDLSKLQGSGPNGRVIAKDVLAAISATTTPTAPAAAFEDVAVTPMRKIISARLTESKQTIPHYYVNQNCYVDELLQVGLRSDCEPAPQATKRGHCVGARRLGGREAREGDDQRLHREGVRDGAARDAGGELQLRQQHDAPLQDDRHQRRRVGGGR